MALETELAQRSPKKPLKGEMAWEARSKVGTIL